MANNAEGPAYSYYTEVQVAVGVGFMIRLGVNPGEFLDFLLGFTTLDLYGDDVAGKPRDPDIYQVPALNWTRARLP